MAAVAAKKLSRLVADDFREIFGSSHDDLAERVGGLARITIECLGRSDALYHNFEHTVLVTTVGRDILLGRTMSERIEPDDYSHLIVACLLHDIGFVRGVLSGDTKTEFVIDHSGKTVKLRAAPPTLRLRPIMSTGRSFSSMSGLAMRRSSTPGGWPMRSNLPLSAARERRPRESSLEPRLVQAADLIGQLGDPLYPKKANALFYELEEIGSNRQQDTSLLPTSSKSTRASTGTPYRNISRTE